MALESEILEIANSMSNGATISLERKEALFPPKRSGLFISPQATYDAYILTIGSGRGDNWWCAMFPKICFPDKERRRRGKSHFFRLGVDKRAIRIKLPTNFVDKMIKMCISGGLAHGNKSWFQWITLWITKKTINRLWIF